ncbi:MAG: ABC transporter permease [Roseburia sp.]
MGKYIVKRLIMIIPLLLVTSIIVFGLVKLAPGDPVSIMLNGKQASEETKASLAAEFNLDKPVVQQYFLWLKSALHGDFGISYKSRISVNEMIASRVGVTFQMILMSMGITLVIALPLGVICAIRKKSFIDAVGSIITYVGSASPVFFTGMVFVIFFCYKANLFPAYGTGTSVRENFKYLFLPSLALGLNQIALDTRILRSSMIEVLNSNYITTVVAKGMPKRNIYFKHAFKNSTIPVVTIIGMQVGYVITGAVLVESVFGISGIGSLIVTSVKTNDMPLIQACTLLLVFVYVLMNSLVDILYAVIDPRVKYDK